MIDCIISSYLRHPFSTSITPTSVYESFVYVILRRHRTQKRESEYNTKFLLQLMSMQRIAKAPHQISGLKRRSPAITFAGISFHQAISRRYVSVGPSLQKTLIRTAEGESISHLYSHLLATEEYVWADSFRHQMQRETGKLFPNFAVFYVAMWERWKHRIFYLFFSGYDRH